MRIGFVTTWLHRGATYVTLNYIKLLQEEHEIFVYARGGEYFDDTLEVKGVKVHKGLRMGGTDIHEKDFFRWVESNDLEVIIFNEQSILQPVCNLKLKYPGVKLGSYIDYYKENTVAEFGVYDFLICNTKRHYSVFSWHEQCLYLPWGVDTDLYSVPLRNRENDEVIFFHSMGMSNRKGTDILIKTFLENKLYQLNSKLVIHTQVDMKGMLPDHCEEYNIEIIHKSVPAPGLYHLGDVYVYPCKLDGLGLTMYEALSCGLPVIATDVAPMNEIVNENVGKLVAVKDTYCRADGYYWPLSVVNENSLSKAMLYYLENRERIEQEKKNARAYAEKNWKLSDRKSLLSEYLKKVKCLPNQDFCKKVLSNLDKQNSHSKVRLAVDLFVPKVVQSKIREKRENKRK